MDFLKIPHDLPVSLFAAMDGRNIEGSAPVV